MADSEFEQFRQYFDKLPQYIKAPAQCYTLVPHIDLAELESPVSPTSNSKCVVPTIEILPSASTSSLQKDYKVELAKNFIVSTSVPSPSTRFSAGLLAGKHEKHVELSLLSSSSNEPPTDVSLTEEPFAGDLQLMSLEHHDDNSSGGGSNKSKQHISANRNLTTPSTNAATTTRKRRKLPEVPKNKDVLQQHQQKNQTRNQQNPKQLTLAEELFNADKAEKENGGGTSFQQHCGDTPAFGGTQLSCNCGKDDITPSSFNRYANIRPYCSDCNTQSFLTSSIIANESSVAQGQGSDSLYCTSNNRPFFLLKFPNNGSCHDEDSSSDSEKYTSMDSGHSTGHSDDGIKQYPSQISSINESYSPSSPMSCCRVPLAHLEVLEATHRGLHKFIPRHHDEIEIDIGDPIYVQREADDLWCEGVNLRSGLQGIFPSAFCVDVDYEDFNPSTNKVKKERYLLSYLGSIETLYHKGNEVLCQAVKKIASQENYVATHARSCILEISDQGIHMVDKGKLLPNHVPCHDYFYALKNVSFCGFHPNDHRYFCFVTKHPTLNRFACHVFISDDSTRPVAEAVGRAFQRFYQKFLETAYPIEDIYLE